MKTKIVNDYKNQLDDYTESFKDNVRLTASFFNRKISEDEVEAIALEQRERVEDVLKNGLDVGGIVEFRIPVSGLLSNEVRGYMYNTSKGLFEISVK